MSSRRQYLFGKVGYKDVIFTVKTYNDAELALSVITFVTPRGTYTLTEGTDWDYNVTDDETVAADIATKVAALPFVEDAQAFADASSDGVVHVMPEPWAEITSVSWLQADGSAITASVATLTQTTTDRYVSVPPSGTRLSPWIRVGDGEYFSVSQQTTVDGAGTPAFDLDYQIAETWSGIDVNGEPAGIEASPWIEIVSTATASDGAWTDYNQELAPPVTKYFRFRYTNNSTSAITATATTGMTAVLRWW